MPVTVVNDPKDKSLREGVRGERQERIQGAQYQMYKARTYSYDYRGKHYEDTSPSICDAGTTTYTVDIPTCGTNCQCLIVASVDGEIRGHVDSDAVDYFIGKARATIDAKLASSLGGTPAQLLITSGDGAESIEITAGFSKEPVNAKIVGKVGDGPLDKISQYSAGPVSFNACFADIKVNAEGSVNSYISWACDEVSSYAEGTLTIRHKCKISAYCVCNGQRTLILEWVQDWDGRRSYLHRSTLDEEYEKKMKKDRDEMRSDTGATGPTFSKGEQSRLLKELAPTPRAARRSPKDGLSKLRESVRTQVLEKREG